MAEDKMLLCTYRITSKGQENKPMETCILKLAPVAPGADNVVTELE
jgi:hypothetical protein